MRPTTDRVKESMFAPLHFRLQGADVLDVFGGSGALGLEAASRGARRVVIVEKSHAAQQAIAANLAACGSPPAIELLRMSWQRAFVCLEGQQFSIVFVDPPYQSGQYEPVLAALPAHGLLAPDAEVILESDRVLEPDVSGYAFVRRKKYGGIYVTVLQQADGAGGDGEADGRK